MRRSLPVFALFLVALALGACRLWAPAPGALGAEAPVPATQPPASPLPEPIFTAAPTATAAPTLAPSPTPGPPPRLTGSYPIAGDTLVRAEFPLTLEFDRPLDRASVEAGMTISPSVAGALEWPADGTVVFRPEGGWTEPDYEVSLTGIRAADGAPLDEPLTLRFGTGGRGIPVPALMYHHVANLPDDATETQRNWTVSPAAFAEQLHYLAREGWRSISPAQFVAYAEEGHPLPPKPLLITIDDGNRNIYANAYPLIMETALRPVLFVIPSHMGYGGYLSWEMTKELAEAGMIIGIHTQNHIALRGQPNEVLEVEIGEAKREVEERLGLAVDSFCYPFGSYDENTIAVLRAHGYTTAFTLNGLPFQPADDPFRLNRLLVRYETTLEEFAALLP
jgi:peptidoglycan/xylan/chitin deacetylase (PgdA/CDA1 family)